MLVDVEGSLGERYLIAVAMLVGVAPISTIFASEWLGARGIDLYTTSRDL